MKTKILLLIISMFLLSCRSAKEPQIIKYDFLKGRFDTANINPYNGRPTVLEIRNINNLFYKVEITPQDIAIKDKSLFDETSAPPKKNESPELGDKKDFTAANKIQDEIIKEENAKKLQTKIDLTSMINVIQNQIKDKERLIDQKQKTKQEWQSLIESVNTQLASLNSLEELNKKQESLPLENIKGKEIIEREIELRKDLERKQDKYETNMVKLNTEIDQLTTEEKQLANKIYDLKNNDMTIKDLIINYLSNIKKLYMQLYLSAENVTHINGCYNNYIDKVYTPELTFKEYRKIKDKEGLENSVIIDKEKLNEFYTEIKQFDKFKIELLMKLDDIELYKIREKLAQLPHGNNLNLDLDNDLNEIKKDVNSISKTINDLDIRKKLNYVESLDRILSTESSYTYTSIPIQGYEDFLQFDVNVVSKTKIGEDKYIIDRSRTFKYKEYLKGGIRFDFSIGTVFDIGNKQQEFDIVQDNDGYKIVQTTNNQYVPTIAGILHSSWRSANNFAIGFSLGFSMDMTKLQLNSLFPGVSLLVGKTDKIIFTAGPALRKVTQLTNGFSLNTSLVSPPQGYTIESYKLGWFVGVSWNLTNKQKSLMRLSY